MVFGAPPSCSDISVLTAPTSYRPADLSVQALLGSGLLWAARKNYCSPPPHCVGGQRSEEELSCVAGLLWSANGLDLRPSHHHLLRLVTGSEKQSINNTVSPHLTIIEIYQIHHRNSQYLNVDFQAPIIQRIS